MPQLFSRSADTFFRLALLCCVGLVCVVVGGLLTVVRSPYITGEGVRVKQQVPFSHEHHVADIGIDCRYCHQTVETSASAGVPSTEICMNCHNELWKQEDMLAPVRASFREDTPLVWERVHDLPDYVFFNHSIHVKKGVGCYECHGRIDEMPLVSQAQPLTMQWCLDCHRNPVPHLRPAELVFEPQPLKELVPQENVSDLVADLAIQNHVQSKMDCYSCHR